MKEQLRHLDELPVHAGTGIPTRAIAGQLLVCGLVHRELELDEVQRGRYPQSALTEDFACDEGWVVPGIAWSGALVGQLLDTGGVVERGQWVEFAAGEYKFTLPIEEARTGLVAHMLNDELLPREHGGPVRLILPVCRVLHQHQMARTHRGPRGAGAEHRTRNRDATARSLREATGVQI